MVSVKNLSVVINNQRLLNDVSCSLVPGRITCFIGQSGAGKTTLLKSLVNLVPATGGEVMINNQQLAQLSNTQRAQAIGYVFQNFNLFPHLTAFENCIDPLLVHGMSYDDAYNVAMAEFKKFGMEAQTHNYPAQLSGGQQQRVAIMRSLCLMPKVILLDEPTASLDPRNTDALVVMLKALAADGLIIGVSSQDMSFVKKLFDRVYYIDAGRIVEYCDAITALSQYPFIEQFIGRR